MHIWSEVLGSRNPEVAPAAVKNTADGNGNARGLGVV